MEQKSSSWTPASSVCKYRFPLQPRATTKSLKNVFPAGFQTSKNRPNAPLNISIDTAPPTAFQYSANILCQAKPSNIAWARGDCEESYLPDAGEDAIDPFTDVAGVFYRMGKQQPEALLNQNASKIVDIVFSGDSVGGSSLLQRYDDSSHTLPVIANNSKVEDKEKSILNENRSSPVPINSLTKPDWSYEEWFQELQSEKEQQQLQQIIKQQKQMSKSKKSNSKLSSNHSKNIATTTTLSVHSNVVEMGSTSSIALVPRQFDESIIVEIYRCNQVLSASSSTSSSHVTIHIPSATPFQAIVDKTIELELPNNGHFHNNSITTTPTIQPSLYYYHPRNNCWRELSSPEHWTTATLAVLELSKEREGDSIPLKIMYSFITGLSLPSGLRGSHSKSSLGKNSKSQQFQQQQQLKQRNGLVEDHIRIQRFVEKFTFDQGCKSNSDTEANMTFRLRTPQGGWSLDNNGNNASILSGRGPSSAFCDVPTLSSPPPQSPVPYLRENNRLITMSGYMQPAFPVHNTSCNYDNNNNNNNNNSNNNSSNTISESRGSGKFAYERSSSGRFNRMTISHASINYPLMDDSHSHNSHMHNHSHTQINKPSLIYLSAGEPTTSLSQKRNQLPPAVQDKQEALAAELEQRLLKTRW